MGKYQDMSLAGLLSEFAALVRTLGADEKAYLKLSLGKAFQTGRAGVILGGAGLAFLALSGVFLLVTVTLLLNVWFQPWASALIMTVLLLSGGLVAGFMGIRKAKEGIAKAQADMNRAKEDVRWLKGS